MSDFYVHPSALVETSEIGPGTKIWAFTHVMKNVVIGADCNIGDHIFIETGVKIGSGVTIKNGVTVWEGVEIEDFVFIGPNASFTNDQVPRSPRHPEVRARYSGKGWLEKTIVREGATIGANATILCGLTLGRYSFVGAGSVVTKSVEPFRLTYGNPSRTKGFVNSRGEVLHQLDVGSFIEPKTKKKYTLENNEIVEVK